MRGVCGEGGALPEVDIVLATYNGEKYLEEQLASIERQGGVSWRLLAADDGSCDGTVALLETFAERHRGRVTLLPPAGRRLGTAAAFGRLLAATSAPYVCLCDQDDVWLPEKLSASVARTREIEAEIGPHPVLVHSDLTVVDARLRTIAGSMDRYQRLGAGRRTLLRHLLVQNSVTGSTVTMNRALLQRALPIPGEAIMHDWWLALVAAAFGRVTFIPRPLVLYRQHGDNALGVRRFGIVGVKGGVAGMRASLLRTYDQAQRFEARFGSQLATDSSADARAFAALPKLGVMSRRLQVVRRGFFKQGIARNVAMLLVM